MALRLVPAGVAHTALLVSLYAHCFDDPWSTESMAAVLASPGAFAAIATHEDGVPVGFVLARHVGDEIEIINLGVLLSQRRRGIGTSLLREVMQRARAACATRVVLEVAETNDSARALYAAYGFMVVGRRPDYYQRANRVPVAALTMSCALAVAPTGGGPPKSIKTKTRRPTT